MILTFLKSLALSFMHWLNCSLCSEVKNGGLPVLGFSCRPSCPSSRKVWTYLLTLVRLTLRNLAICVRECPFLKWARASGLIFIWMDFCWLASFLKSILLRLSIANQFCCWTASIGSCFYLDWYYLSVEWCSLARVEKSQKTIRVKL